MATENDLTYRESIRTAQQGWQADNQLLLRGYFETVAEELKGSVRSVRLVPYRGKLITVAPSYLTQARGLRGFSGYEVTEKGKLSHLQWPTERVATRGHIAYHRSRVSSGMVGVVHFQWMDSGRFEVEQIEHDLRQLYPDSENIYFQFYDGKRIINLQ